MKKIVFFVFILVFSFVFIGTVYAEYNCKDTTDPDNCPIEMEKCDELAKGPSAENQAEALACYATVQNNYPVFVDKCQNDNDYDDPLRCSCEAGKSGKIWACLKDTIPGTRRIRFFEASGPDDPYNGSCFNACSSQPARPAITVGFNCNDNECYDREEGRCRQISRVKCGTDGIQTMSTAKNGDCVFSACQESPATQPTLLTQSANILSKAEKYCEGDSRCLANINGCLGSYRTEELRANTEVDLATCQRSYETYSSGVSTATAPSARPAAPAAPAVPAAATGGQPAAPRTSVSPTEEEGPGCDGVDSVWGIWEKGEDGKFSKLKQEKSRLRNDPQCGFKLSQAQQDEIAVVERARSEAAQQDQAPKRTVTAVKVNGRDVGTKNPKVPLNLLDLCKDDFFAGKCIVTVEYFYSSGDPKRIALKLKPASSLINKESGQPCNKTAQCKQGLICIGEDEGREFGLPKDRCYPSPKVTTKLPDGADCVSNSQCVTGDCRTGGTCDTAGGCKGKCIGGGKPGEFCRHDDECPSGYFCPGEGESGRLNIQKDRCTPSSVRSSSSSGGSSSSSSSSSCGTTQRQPSGSKCLGQSCSQDSECKTGYCCTGSSCTNKGKCTNADGSI